MQYSITIPRWHPTLLNKLLQLHWAERARRKKVDYQMVGTYAVVQHVLPATGKRRVSAHLTLSGRGRSPDADGVLKVLLDALVASRMLVDDSDKWCELGSVTFERGKGRATRITLEDME